MLLSPCLDTSPPRWALPQLRPGRNYEDRPCYSSCPKIQEGREVWEQDGHSYCPTHCHFLLKTHLQLPCHEKSRRHSQGCCFFTQPLCQAPFAGRRNQGLQGQVTDPLHGLRVCSASPAAQPFLLAALQCRHCFSWAVMGTVSLSCSTRECGCCSICPVAPTCP